MSDIIAYNPITGNPTNSSCSGYWPTRETICGTCSICGGAVAVVVPTYYWSINPPTPQCKSCGAYAKKNFGPIIDMVPAPQDFTCTWGTGSV